MINIVKSNYLKYILFSLMIVLSAVILSYFFVCYIFENLNNNYKDRENITVEDKIEIKENVLQKNNIDNMRDISNMSNINNFKEPTLFLPLSFKSQKNYYYCGPATLDMLSSYFGKTITQDQWGKYLAVDNINGTRAGDFLQDHINQYFLKNNINIKYKWHWHKENNINVIREDVIRALKINKPVIVNTVEYGKDALILGHEKVNSLFHFGLVIAYYEEDDSVIYLDPGAGQFDSFFMMQRISLSKLSYAVLDRGYLC